MEVAAVVVLALALAWQVAGFPSEQVGSLVRFSEQDRAGVKREAEPQDTTAGTVGAAGVVVGRVRHLGEDIAITRSDVWLARCIYAETNRAREQELVAWVVRNRVETHFRGRETYRGVVLDPGQFSPFNAGSARRDFYLRLFPESRAPGWTQALLLARGVRRAPSGARPFPIETRHFYSEQSMPAERPASWAVGRRPVIPRRPYDIDLRRFRFFANLSPDS